MDGASLTVRGHGTLGHRELIIDDNRDDCGFSCALVCFLDRAFCLLFACLMMLAAGCMLWVRWAGHWALGTVCLLLID